MPFLKVELTNDVSPQLERETAARLRAAIHEIKGDPESMVSVFIQGGVRGVFGKSNQPAANIHLESFDLTPPITSRLTARISSILQADLGISPDSAYLFFYNVPQPHLTSWGGKTFAELLSPRSGSRADLTRRMRGRFLNSSNHPRMRNQVPLAGLVVELWRTEDVTVGGIRYEFLSRTTTDAEGFFDLYFSPPSAAERPSILELRVFEPDQFVIVDGRPATRRFVAYVHPIRDEGRFPDMPLGIIFVPFYGYDSNWPFPYAVPESIRNGFSDRQEGRFRESEALATTIGALLFGELDSTPGGVSIDTVQSRFPEAPTMKMERDRPGSSRSDEFFADRLLNNMAPALLRIDPNVRCRGADQNIYVLDYNWRAFERRNDLTLLSFRARFTNDGNRLTPYDILIGENNNDITAKYTRFVPADGDHWMQAKRLVRAHYNNLVGQVQHHLAQTHFNMEQYAIPLLRHVFRHPLRNILYPFIREILAINEKGRNTLLGGPSIVYEIEPISRKSVADWVVNTLGNADWKGFSPRTPLCQSHGFAHAASIYWEILTSVVDDYFAAHAHAMQNGWEEIIRYSAALVDHSVPFADKPMEEPDDAGPWYCVSEISQRGRVGMPAVSPVATAAMPHHEAVENIKQVCRYVIYYSTFVHSWTHEKMLLDLGELKYSGMVCHGGLGPESDERYIAPVRQATFALGSTHTLGAMNCGTMLRNEDGDVPSELITRLKSRRNDFQAHGFDVERLCARLNT